MALSDAAGDTVQTYEYSVYGEVAVEDANHTNPYMFAGVRYDRETGVNGGRKSGRHHTYFCVKSGDTIHIFVLRFW